MKEPKPMWDCGLNNCFTCTYPDCVVSANNTNKNKIDYSFAFRTVHQEHTIPEVNLKEIWGWTIE